MVEYEVSFTSPSDGEILLDVYTSEGTSQYVKFKSRVEVRSFFLSLGLSDEMVTEVERICTELRAGEAFHQKMFLPESIVKTIQSAAA